MNYNHAIYRSQDGGIWMANRDTEFNHGQPTYRQLMIFVAIIAGIFLVDAVLTKVG